MELPSSRGWQRRCMRACSIAWPPQEIDAPLIANEWRPHSKHVWFARLATEFDVDLPGIALYGAMFKSAAALSSSGARSHVIVRIALRPPPNSIIAFLVFLTFLLATLSAAMSFVLWSLNTSSLILVSCIFLQSNRQHLPSGKVCRH